MSTVAILQAKEETALTVVQAVHAPMLVVVEEDTAVAAVALAVLAAQLAATEDQEPMELPLREPTQDLEALGVVL